MGAGDALWRWYGHAQDRWPEFQRRYRAELAQHPEHWVALMALARNEPVTLRFSVRDEERNNAVALATFLAERVLESEKIE